MIRIKRYSELPDSDRIFNLYLFMAAMSMPFYPEDIFPDGYYYPDGVTKMQLDTFPRTPRRRTANYNDRLNDFGITGSILAIDEETEDALLAEAIIQDYSDELHEFLYDGMAGGHVNPDALRLLLTTPVDKKSIDSNSKLKNVFDYTDQTMDSGLMLEHVFRYETFSRRKEIYQFVSLLGVEICPYCNRLYITVAERTKNGSPIRPELDHYRNKSFYPYFALSILNLIPSCSVCNHVKSSNTDEILYPYAEGIENDYSFRTKPSGGITYLAGTRVAKDDFILSLQNTRPDMDGEKEERAKNSIQILRLDSMYSAQKEYVSDMMFQRYIFTDPMIQDLMNQFPDLFTNEREVRNMLLMMDTSQNSWGKRPLAKLTHDISEELDELYEAAGIELKDKD